VTAQSSRASGNSSSELTTMKAQKRAESTRRTSTARPLPLRRDPVEVPRRRGDAPALGVAPVQHGAAPAGKREAERTLVAVAFLASKVVDEAVSTPTRLGGQRVSRSVLPDGAAHASAIGGEGQPHHRRAAPAR